MSKNESIESILGMFFLLKGSDGFVLGMKTKMMKLGMMIRGEMKILMQEVVKTP